MTLPRLLRGGAIAIVLLALWDPVVHRDVPSEAIVAVFAEGPHELADRVADRLASRVTVVRAPFPGASASVYIGRHPPRGQLETGEGPLFVVIPQTTPGIDRIEAPARAPLEGVVELRVMPREGAAGELELLAGGIPVDRVELDGARAVLLTHTPAEAGPLLLELRGPEIRHALLVEIDDAAAPVLFQDGRPSWMSSFVRRAAEQDRTLAITSRTVTAPALATTGGTAPPSLTAPGALDGYRLVVTGAPELLTPAQLQALERFARETGGSILLLLDHLAPGPWESLAGVRAWATRAGEEGLPEVSLLLRGEPAPGGRPLIATELAWPETLPPGARVIVSTDDEMELPIVWERPLGAGRVVVSGALDGWRFRDPGEHSFELFWLALLGELAARTPAPLSIEVGEGARAPVRVLLRKAALAGEGRAEVVARIISGEGEAHELTLWPTGVPGELVGRLPGGLDSGMHRIEVEAGELRGERHLLAGKPTEPQAAGGEEPALAHWATSRGGSIVDEVTVAAAVEAVLEPERRREPRHPFRSPLWILPLALLLGGEWWWRRRRGLL